ncbi:MAG: nuclear transport factor 2 family protein [Blastocatellia bacterium]
MSEQTNVQIIQQAYAAFGQGNVQGILALLSEDVRWHVAPAANVAYTGTRMGKAGALEFFTGLGAAEETLQFAPGEFVAQGDRVMVIGQYAGRVRETGREYQTYFIHAFTVRGGLITSFDEYTDTAAVSGAFVKTQTA